MASRSKLIETLQRLQRRRVDSNSLVESLYTLKVGHKGGPNDRAAILIATALLEQSLEDAIAHALPQLTSTDRKKLFEGDYEREGIIGSLYSKAFVGYALAIYGTNTLGDISTIRYIRNSFAHSKTDVNLSDSVYSDLCEFHVVSNFIWGGVVGDAPTSPRDKFISAVILLCHHFWLRCSDYKGHGSLIEFMREKLFT